MRKLLHVVFAVLKNKTTFNPELNIILTKTVNIRLNQDRLEFTFWCYD